VGVRFSETQGGEQLEFRIKNGWSARGEKGEKVAGPRTVEGCCKKRKEGREEQLGEDTTRELFQSPQSMSVKAGRKGRDVYESGSEGLGGLTRKGREARRGRRFQGSIPRSKKKYALREKGRKSLFGVVEKEGMDS